LVLLTLSVTALVSASTAIVKMREIGGTNYIFDPSSISIKTGDTVTWTNTLPDPHDTTSDTRVWASRLLSSTSTNNSFSFTFTDPGIYPYHCNEHFLRGHPEETGTVSVLAPNVSPVVAISSPTNGAAFFAPASFTIQAAASDSDGTVTQLQLFRGTSSIAVSMNSPLSTSLSALAAGSYVFSAIATDNSGARTTSSVVHVSVSAPPTISSSSAQILPDGTFQFRISGGSAGQTCIIDACESLPNWAPILTTNFPDTKCEGCPYIDVIDKSNSSNRRFYRHRVFP
jgi:plastocyanin